MSEIKHVLGISGGKDSAALAIYMSQKHSDVNVEYYTCDTGKELTETYDLINKLNSVLGKNIRLYKSRIKIIFSRSNITKSDLKDNYLN